MTMTLDGTNGVTFNDTSLQGAAASPYVLKNRIINGDMRIDQRNAGASVTPTNGQYTLDRWTFGLNQASKFTTQQNAAAVTPPTGYTYYLGVTSSSTYSVLAGDYFVLSQAIEGYNIADLAWGTANAKTITISFWVRSSLTGTFGGCIQNNTTNRSYPFTYTISLANTWEQKSVTIAGDTSGTWQSSTATGMYVYFSLGVGTTFSGTAGSWSGSNFVSATGATSVVGTSGATFYITGVQLEQNTSATPFERRLYGQEFINCQRYFNRFGGSSSDVAFGIGFKDSASTISLSIQMPVSLRATPSVSLSGTVYTIGGAQLLSLSSPSSIILSLNSLIVRFKATTSAPITNSETSFSFYTGSAPNYVDYSSEL